jgi:lipopolysaccharide assembly outer membrane protein LptD (OstA)
VLALFWTATAVAAASGPDTLMLAPPAADSAFTHSLVPRPESLPRGHESLDVVHYGGKRVIFNAAQSMVYLLDSAWVVYQDMQLKSDSIVYDIKKHLLSSYRSSRFRTASDTVIGAELHYNLDTRKGYMDLANTEVGNGFFGGNSLWIVKDKVLDVNDATYTTCERKIPHYTFWGKRVRVYLDDMVVAEPLVMRVGRVPVIAAPFWFFPISKHRKSGLMTFKVGHSTDEGFYAKNVSWFWAINDYSDATFALDVMTRKGFQWSGEGEYVVGPYATGSFLGSYIRESDTKHTRYSIAANHDSRFFYGSHLNARADFQSDATYVSDYSETPQLWLKNELDSYASIGKTFKNVGTLNITARRYVNLNEHHTDTDFPNIGLSLTSLPLGRGWSINSGLSAANHETRRDIYNADTTRIDTTYIDRTLGLSPRLSLSLPQSFLGGFNLPLGFGYTEQTHVQRDSSGDSLTRSRQASTGTGFGFSQNAFGFLNLSEGVSYSENYDLIADSTSASYGLSAGSQFSLCKIFGIEALGVHGMLHKVTPVVNYSFRPYTPRRHGLYGIPRFDTLPQSSSFGLGLNNDFQIKVGEDRVKRELGNINFGSGYDLRPDPSGTSDTARRPTLSLRRLSPITGVADFVILDLDQAKLRTTGRTSFNPNDPNGPRFGDFSVSSVFSYGITVADSVAKTQRHFSVGLQHFLGWRDTAVTDHMLTAEVQVEPRGWAFKLGGGWNIKDHKLTDYSIALTKDLHCWELVADLSHLGTRWTYDLKLRIKAIPDVAIGKGLFGWAMPSQFR